MNNRGVIAWFASNPVAANLLMIFILVMGVISSLSLRKEAFPSLEPSRITISAVYSSGDPKQTEEAVSMKIEQALEDVEGIKRITSTSTANSSNVVVEKESGFDLETLSDSVRDRVDSITGLPSDTEAIKIEKAVRGGKVVTVQIYGDVSQLDLQGFSETFRLALLENNAIKKVSVSGVLDRYININVNPELLDLYDLSLSDIVTAVNNESSPSSSASIRNGSGSFALKISEQIYSKDEFINIPIKAFSDGSVLKLSEIASVEDSFDESQFNVSRFNSYPSVAINVEIGEFGDILVISENVQKVISEWQSSDRIPNGITVTSWDDSSEAIKDRLSLLVSNAITGIILVFIILALFLNIRVAFWVAAGLPFIFTGTMFVMDTFTGLTINQMTTFGFLMALGIVVDDAVVVGESVYHERFTHGDNFENTLRGTLRVAIPTIFGVLTTVVTFYALSSIEGGLGQIFAQFGTVVTICLIFSMIESKLILPAHLSHLKTQRVGEKVSLWNKVQNRANAILMTVRNRMYVPALKALVKYRYGTVIISAVMLYFIASMPFNGTVGVSFFPDIKQETSRATITLGTGIGYDATRKALLALEETAYEADRVLGEKYNSDELTNIKNIQVKSSSDKSGTANVEFIDGPSYGADEFSSVWASLNNDIQGLERSSFLSRMEMVDNYRIELKSVDSRTLESAEVALAKMVKSLDGIQDVEVGAGDKKAKYKINVNKYGRHLGLTTKDVSNQIFQAFGGSKTQKFQEGMVEIVVSVRYPGDERDSISDLRDFNVKLSSGALVPLSDVATAKVLYESDSIVRIDGKRSSTVTASVDKDIISSEALVKLTTEEFMPIIQKKYPDISYKVAGEAEQQAETMHSMLMMSVMSLLAIYALIAIPLRSYIQPLLIMTSIPFGVAGAVLGHWATGLSVSLLSLFGILALSGVVVNDSLLLVSRFNEFKDKGSDLVVTVVECCSNRFRAVLLTSITTFFGLYPILSETSLQAEFLKPAAASLGYGILFATAITLVLIPCLLIILEDVKKLLLNVFRK